MDAFQSFWQTFVLNHHFLQLLLHFLQSYPRLCYSLNCLFGWLIVYFEDFLLLRPHLYLYSSIYSRLPADKNYWLVFKKHYRSLSLCVHLVVQHVHSQSHRLLQMCMSELNLCTHLYLHISKLRFSLIEILHFRMLFDFKESAGQYPFRFNS